MVATTLQFSQSVSVCLHRLEGPLVVPERPIQLIFGCPDRKTLFGATREEVYSVQIP